MSDVAERSAAILHDDYHSRPPALRLWRLFVPLGQRLMAPYFAEFGLTPPQFQLLTIANCLRKERPTHAAWRKHSTCRFRMLP